MTLLAQNIMHTRVSSYPSIYTYIFVDYDSEDVKEIRSVFDIEWKARVRGHISTS